MVTRERAASSGCGHPAGVSLSTLCNRSHDKHGLGPSTYTQSPVGGRYAKKNHDPSTKHNQQVTALTNRDWKHMLTASVGQGIDQSSVHRVFFVGGRCSSRTRGRSGGTGAAAAAPCVLGCGGGNRRRSGGGWRRFRRWVGRGATLSASGFRATRRGSLVHALVLLCGVVVGQGWGREGQGYGGLAAKGERESEAPKEQTRKLAIRRDNNENKTRKGKTGKSSRAEPSLQRQKAGGPACTGEKTIAAWRRAAVVVRRQ